MGLTSSHDWYPKWKGFGIFLWKLPVEPSSHFIAPNYKEASADQSYEDYDSEYSLPSTSFNIFCSLQDSLHICWRKEWDFLVFGGFILRL